MRVLIKYARKDAAKYISHLDMQRCFARALRRAGVDVAYSQGFNPHIVMSFASPLSVGIETNGDYLEVATQGAQPADEIARRLNEALPPQIRVLLVRELAGNKKLMALNHSARYKIDFDNFANCDRISKAAEEMMSAEQLLVENKHGKQIDVRPLILELSAQENRIDVRLQNSSASSLNPAAFAKALMSFARTELQYSICREDCFALQNGVATPFSMIDFSELESNQ